MNDVSQIVNEAMKDARRHSRELGEAIVIHAEGMRVAAAWLLQNRDALVRAGVGSIDIALIGPVDRDALTIYAYGGRTYAYGGRLWAANRICHFVGGEWQTDEANFVQEIAGNFVVRVRVGEDEMKRYHAQPTS